MDIDGYRYRYRYRYICRGTGRKLAVYDCDSWQCVYNATAATSVLPEGVTQLPYITHSPMMCARTGAGDGRALLRYTRG